MADHKPCWCVWRDGLNGTVTFGPFASKEEAEKFCHSPYGGHAYDAVANSKFFSLCGPWLP